MLTNYLKIAWRNLMKYKLISFINLFGLTVGLTCCLLITIYVLHELSYDRYNENADRIYRITRTFNNTEGVVSLKLSTVSSPFGYYLPTDYPDIQKMTRLLNNGITPLQYRDKLFNEKDAYFADENLFDMFTVKVLRGNPKTALIGPYSVMLTEETASKYFGTEDPMDKILKFNNRFSLKVTGVYRAFPSNAHMHPGMLISFSTLKDTAIYGEENLRTSWGDNSFFTYLMFPKGYPVDQMRASFPAFVDRRMDKSNYNGMRPSLFTRLDLQKLTDIHLHSHMDYEAEPNGDIKRVYVFSFIALFILLIACINYMNLSTARSALRAREIGIRKVVGASRKELVMQFLSESVLLTVLANLLAFSMLYFLLPFLNRLSGEDLSLGVLYKPWVILLMLVTPFAVGLLSGAYPALFISSFEPIKTLKGLFRANGSHLSLRQVLVGAQFAISIILIISTIVVYRQMQYIQQAALGYDKEHVVIMPYNNQVHDHYEAFRTELLRDAGLRDVARSSRIPTGRLLDGLDAYTLSGDSMKPVQSDLRYLAVDYDFVATYGIPVAAGRNFSRTFGVDTSNFLINETAAAALGWTPVSNAVGNDFKYGGVQGHIIGVVGDFHFESLHQKIAPMVFALPSPSQNFFNALSVKIAGANTDAAMSALEKSWKKYYPEVPYEYTFLDDNFDKLYQSEQKQGSLFTLFACIAILIACLGLFGLSAFAISQRTKEIGIRKVLGAETGGIVMLLSKDFVRLVGIAALIAFPVAWYAMHRWLLDFAYRTNISWWIYLLAAAIALLIALVTVGFQAVRAAWLNPVKSLRSE